MNAVTTRDKSSCAGLGLGLGLGLELGLGSGSGLGLGLGLERRLLLHSGGQHGVELRHLGRCRGDVGEI